MIDAVSLLMAPPTNAKSEVVNGGDGSSVAGFLALVAEFLALPEADSVPEEKKDENEGSNGTSEPTATAGAAMASIPALPGRPVDSNEKKLPVDENLTAGSFPPHPTTAAASLRAGQGTDWRAGEDFAERASDDVKQEEPVGPHGERRPAETGSLERVVADPAAPATVAATIAFESNATAGRLSVTWVEPGLAIQSGSPETDTPHLARARSPGALAAVASPPAVSMSNGLVRPELHRRAFDLDKNRDLLPASNGRQLDAPVAIELDLLYPSEGVSAEADNEVRAEVPGLKWRPVGVKTNSTDRPALSGDAGGPAPPSLPKEGHPGEGFSREPSPDDSHPPQGGESGQQSSQRREHQQRPENSGFAPPLPETSGNTKNVRMPFEAGGAAMPLAAERPPSSQSRETKLPAPYPINDARVEKLMAEPARARSGPLEIRIDLPRVEHDGKPVQLHLREHQGEVQLAVRTADIHLGQSLQEGLPELISSLEGQGFENRPGKEIGGPLSTGAEAPVGARLESSEMKGGDSPSSNQGGQRDGDSPPRPFSGDSPGGRPRNEARWLEAWRRSFLGEPEERKSA